MKKSEIIENLISIKNLSLSEEQSIAIEQAISCIKKNKKLKNEKYGLKLKIDELEDKLKKKEFDNLILKARYGNEGLIYK